jgi:hypothetical protein
MHTYGRRRVHIETKQADAACASLRTEVARLEERLAGAVRAREAAMERLDKEKSVVLVSWTVSFLKTNLFWIAGNWVWAVVCLRRILLCALCCLMICRYCLRAWSMCAIWLVWSWRYLVKWLACRLMWQNYDRSHVSVESERTIDWYDGIVIELMCQLRVREL